MKLITFFFNHHVVRYLISGAASFAVNFTLLFLLTHVFHLYYIISGIISFLCAVIVSFIMQKKWTFQDHSTEDTHKKFVVFVVVALINLVANTGLLYFFTEVTDFHYLVSQFVTSILIAIWSFFIYKVVFR